MISLMNKPADLDVVILVLFSKGSSWLNVKEKYIKKGKSVLRAQHNQNCQGNSVFYKHTHL